MKKLIITLLVLIGIAAVAVITCPDRQAHREAIMAVINESLHEELDVADDDGLSMLLGTVGSGIAGYFIDNRLTVKNHFVYSTAELKDLDGVDQQVSVGVFGHVFTFDKEDLRNVLEQ